MTAEEIMAVMEMNRHLRTLNNILMLRWGMEFDENGDVVEKQNDWNDD